jgi:hypothetical protein
MEPYPLCDAWRRLRYLVGAVRGRRAAALDGTGEH